MSKKLKLAGQADWLSLEADRSNWNAVCKTVPKNITDNWKSTKKTNEFKIMQNNNDTYNNWTFWALYKKTKRAELEHTLLTAKILGFKTWWRKRISFLKGLSVNLKYTYRQFFRLAESQQMVGSCKKGVLMIAKAYYTNMELLIIMSGGGGRQRATKYHFKNTKLINKYFLIRLL